MIVVAGSGGFFLGLTYEFAAAGEKRESGRDERLESRRKKKDAEEVGGVGERRQAGLVSEGPFFPSQMRPPPSFAYLSAGVGYVVREFSLF